MKQKKKDRPPFDCIQFPSFEMSVQKQTKKLTERRLEPFLLLHAGNMYDSDSRTFYFLLVTRSASRKVLI